MNERRRTVTIPLRPAELAEALAPLATGSALVEELAAGGVTWREQVEMARGLLSATQRTVLRESVGPGQSPAVRDFVEAVVGSDGLLTGQRRLGATSAFEAREREPARVRVPTRAIGAAGRSPVVALFRIRMKDEGEGVVRLDNASPGRPISEPGTELLFTNARTGETARVALDAQGSFARGQLLAGQPGDSFSVAAPGAPGDVVGTVRVAADRPSPGLVPSMPAPAAGDIGPDGTLLLGRRRPEGPLFVDLPSHADVEQGRLGDCHVVAAARAMAVMCPAALTGMMDEHRDGSCTVTFREQDWTRWTFTEVQVTVDGELYVDRDGTPAYGRTPPGRGRWWPVLEKAYAQLRGGYGALDAAGRVSDVFEAFCGEASSLSVAAHPERAWLALASAVDRSQPVAVTTALDDGQGRFAGTGLVPDHAYAVGGYHHGPQRRVVLLRPFCPGELTLTLDRFAELCAAVVRVRPA